MRLSTFLNGFATVTSAALLATASAAQQTLEIVGRPVDTAMGFQPAATVNAREVHDLDYMLLIIITVITVFVTGLLLWVMFRYNAKRNPKPANFTHNSPLEIAWTIIPIVILVFIGAFSLPVLFSQMEPPKADLVVKVTGNQWYWNYVYPDVLIADDPTQPLTFDSFMIGSGKVMNAEVEAELVAAGYTKDEFLLATDTAMVVPVNKNIIVQLTGADVIHGWMMPALGVQSSAVPGRLNEVWFNADREGVYFGQCSSLCGKDHAYMPITVKVVSQAAYDAWVAKAKGGDVVLSALEASAPLKVAATD
jgi:cytochrome c oxidase subunit II